MKRIWKVGSLGIDFKRMKYERIAVPTLLYRAETLGLKAREKRRLNVMEIMCLRRIFGVPIRDRVRNEEIRR